MQFSIYILPEHFMFDYYFFMIISIGNLNTETLVIGISGS